VPPAGVFHPGLLPQGHAAHGVHPRAAQAAAGDRRARLAGPGQHRAGGPGRAAGARVHAGGVFGPEEYRQVVAYHYRMARHHLFKAQTYREHAKARYGVQLPLFNEDGDEDDGPAAT
jgi:hypothetical protein